MYVQSTLVSGLEINSHTWEIRHFHCRRDPFTQIQLTGLRYSPYTFGGSWVTPTDLNSLPAPPIQAHLRATSSLPERWDLVRLWDRFETRGRGSILVNLVDADGYGSSQYWVDWTSKEGTKAAEMWPAAQQLVIFGLYSRLPDLFELALYEKDDAKFQQAVAQRMQADLLRHSRDLHGAGDAATARAAAKAGLAYGEHAELRAMSEQK